MVRSLRTSLKQEGIDVMGTSDRIQLARLLRQGRYELAVVDSLTSIAELSCDFYGAHVVLAVRKGQADWSAAQERDIYGYISVDAGASELAARLRAIARRARLRDGDSGIYSFPPFLRHA